MWYIPRHETSNLCSAFHRRRTTEAGYRPALVRGLCPAPLPNPARQCTRRAGWPDCPNSWLRRPNRAQCHSSVQHPRPCRPNARLLHAPSDAHAVFDPRREQLRALLHRSPRNFGKPTSLWTLDLVAEVAYAEGMTPRPVSGETIRQALAPRGRLEAGQDVDHQPRPGVRAKKTARPADPAGGRGTRTGCWASRTRSGGAGWRCPALHAWAAGDEPMRLRRPWPRRPRTRRRWPATGCCCGADDPGEMLLRFVEGRPVSQVTEDFLAWVCERLAAEGKRALLLVWDNAAWHVSRRVRAWIRRAQPAGQGGGAGCGSWRASCR